MVCCAIRSANSCTIRSQYAARRPVISQFRRVDLSARADVGTACRAQTRKVAMTVQRNESIVGASVARKEGRDKVTGRARYVDDMTLPGMLFGATVRSSVARGKIKKISFGPGVEWDEFVIVTAADIPGKNCIALILEDQPCLADGAVNHAEEPILLLAHPERHKLWKAIAAVSIEYDKLPTVDTIEASESGQQIVWGDDNVFKKFLIEKGDVDSVWANAAHIVE